MQKGNRELLKADIKDGYTQIPNILLEALVQAKLNGKEKGAALYLCRKTYGWHKNGSCLKEAIVSLKEWTNAINTEKSHASSILARLAAKNVIIRQFIGPGKGYYYSINIRVGEWGDGCINKERLRVTTKQPLPKSATHGLLKNITHSATNLTSRKETLNKTKRNNDSDKYIKGLYGHMVRR